MNKEILLQTIQELIKENNNLKKINKLLHKGIETIQEEAKQIAPINEREYIRGLCTGVLDYIEMFSNKLGVKNE